MPMRRRPRPPREINKNNEVALQDQTVPFKKTRRSNRKKINDKNEVTLHNPTMPPRPRYPPREANDDNIKFCKLCLCRLPPTSYNLHVNGKKHIRNLPARIIVKGRFGKDDHSKLNEYFAQFGAIRYSGIHVNSKNLPYGIYQFVDPKVYTKVIHSVHKFNGINLTISWRNVPKQVFPLVSAMEGEPNEDSKSTAPETPSTSQSSENVDAQLGNNDDNTRQMDPADKALWESISIAKTFDEQIHVLNQKLKENDEKIKEDRQFIYYDLTEALTPGFRYCKIHFFGSSVTGLDYKGSDLDIYVEDVNNSDKSEVDKLKRIRYYIYKCRKFSDVLLISKAKVPIIKCIHAKTQMCCDINVKNKLSVANSQLIKYYLSLDEKLPQIMIAIKYWAEAHGLKKANYFTSYALYMLVIFYLQQEPYNLPPVFALQTASGAVIEDGWNCGFSQLHSMFNIDKLKQSSILDLFKGFLEFYSKFDYMSQVICPYLGRTLKKIHFVNPCNTLPDCYVRYKTIAVNKKSSLKMSSSFCIQDPFEHNRNVAGSTNTSAASIFTACCKLSLKKLTESQLLTDVLTTTVNFNRYELEIVKSSPNKNGEQSENEWIESARNLTLTVMKDVLSLQLTEMPPKGPLQTIYIGDAASDVWEDRPNIHKNLLMQLPNEISMLDQEIAVTACFVRYIYPRVLLGKLKVEIAFKKDPCRMHITLLNHLPKKFKYFLHFAHYLEMKLPVFIQAMEKPKRQDLSQRIQEAVDHEGSKHSSKIKKPDPAIENLQEKMIKQDVDTKRDNTESTNIDVKIPAKTNEEEKSDNNLTIKESPAKLPQKEPAVIEVDNAAKELKEDDEEDVPADFFDDFANEDFMDGLDIVDAWDDDIPDEESAEKPESANNTEESTASKRLTSPERRVEFSSEKQKRSRSPLRRRRSPLTRVYRSRSRSRGKKRTLDMRRDPEKTKRDINRDKITKTKDKEQKLVSDKLKLVETGLVPPGTEMDVDLNSVMKTTRVSLKNEERVQEKRYVKRSRSGSRELRRRHSRSPILYRNVNRSRKRSASHDSNLSEREMWIRGRKSKDSRKRSRSRSRDSRPRKRSRSRDTPLRSMARKYEEKKKFDARSKKKSFLEEIREKLNEVSRPSPPQMGHYPHNVMPQYPNPVPAPVPVPVPAPAQFFSQNPPAPSPAMSQYDQRFFIGDNFVPGQANIAVNQPRPMLFCNPAPPNTVPVVSAPQIPNLPQIRPESQPKINLPSIIQDVVKNVMNSPAVRRDMQEKTKGASADIDKLFADKKISLTDFLTITAKPEVHSSSPEHLQKKIKVISRCQDAIKAMSDDRKFTGRLQVKAIASSLSSDQRGKSDIAYQSPLRRIPVVRFQFTTPPKPTEEVDSFAIALDKILLKIGLITETVNLDDIPDDSVKGSSLVFGDEKMSPAKTFKKVDRITCEECKRRKSKVYADVGAQCIDIKETVSISTQVTEEDLNPSKGFPKNDSLAYLTPAQLLGKEKDKEIMPTPPAPLINSNEKKSSEKRETPPAKKNEGVKGGFKGREPFRQAAVGRGRPNYIDFEEPFDYVERSRSNFDSISSRLGPPTFQQGPFPPQRHFMNNGPPAGRISQFRDDNDVFMDFNDVYRARNPNINRFGPRY